MISDEIQSWQQPDSNRIRELILANRDYRQHHDHHHDQNYVFQLEDDMVIRKSAERKFARHPHNSILIQTTGDGSINNARFWQWKNNNPPGELEEITDLSEKEILLSKMGKKKRILLHGHGGQVQKKDGTGYKKVIANLGAEEVKRRLQPFIQKISETGNLQQVRLVLLGCELVWPGERPTDDNSFLANLMRPLQGLAKRGIQVEGKASLHIQASSHLNLKTLILIEGFFYGHVITKALNKEEALEDGFTSKVNFKYERNTEGVVTLKNVTEYNDKFSTDEIKWLQLRNQLEQPESISFTTFFEKILQPDKKEKRFNKKMKNIFFQLIENTDLDNLPLEISGLKLKLQELKAEIKSTGSKNSVFEFIGDGEILLGLKRYQLRDYITYLVQVATRTERKIFIQDSSFQAIELAPYFMMYTNLMTYPLKFRQHVLAIKEKEKLTYAKTASRFGVGMASLMRWNRRITPCTTHNKPATKIDMEALAQDVATYPDDYQYERAQRFGVSAQGIRHALKRLRVSRKKNTSASQS